MDQIIKAMVLGIVQGATEFLPVSSSAHLVIVPWLLGWTPGSLLFDTVLHWGTLVSIILVFWADFVHIIRATLISLVRRSLADPYARLGWWIVVATIPAAVTGFFLKDPIEGLFQAPVITGVFLFVTAAILWGSDWLTRRGSSATRRCGVPYSIRSASLPQESARVYLPA